MERIGDLERKIRMLGFGLFGRCEISIFLVLRTIPDGFPLNLTYTLLVGRRSLSIN